MRIAGIKAVLCALVVMFVVEGLQKASAIESYGSKIESMSVSFSKNIVVIKPSAEPDPTIIAFHCFYLCLGKSMLHTVMPSARFTPASSNHVFWNFIKQDRINRIDRISGEHRLYTNLAYDARSFPIVFEAVLNFDNSNIVLVFFWRGKVYFAKTNKAVEIVIFNHDIESGSFRSDGSISGFFGGVGTNSSNIYLVLCFDELKAKYFFGVFNLSFASPPQGASRNPQPDCGDSENDGETSNKLVLVGMQELGDVKKARLESEENEAIRKGAIILITAIGGLALVYWACRDKR